MHVCMDFTSSWEDIETVHECVFFLRLQDCDPHNCMSETIFNLNFLTTFRFGLWDQTVIWTLQGCYKQHSCDYHHLHYNYYHIIIVICIIKACTFLEYQVGL